MTCGKRWDFRANSVVKSMNQSERVERRGTAGTATPHAHLEHMSLFCHKTPFLHNSDFANRACFEKKFPAAHRDDKQLRSGEDQDF